ncbi:MAG: endonuclease/exonuclease/phosphatase, partial [Acidobacteria bacterium]
MKKLVTLHVIAIAIAAAIARTSAPLNAISAGVVISQVYGGGGNSGATLKNDFIELFNRGTVAVNVSGWSVQYAATAGTTWQRTNLPPVTVPPGGYLLVQEAAGAGGTTDLPAPDSTGNIAMSATSGKVALVNTTTVLAGSGCPFAAT